MKEVEHFQVPTTAGRGLTWRVRVDKLPFTEENCMPNDSIHVLRHPKGWAVKRRNSSRASKTFDSQQDAIIWGKKASRNDGVEFVIHRPDGTVKSRDTFAKDPVAVRDRSS